jgi:hypothetical protein
MSNSKLKMKNPVIIPEIANESLAGILMFQEKVF